MGLKLRKSIKIAPGIKINLSKSGISTTLGKRGASVNVGKKGVYSNIGIPGTGISMRDKIGGSSSSTSTQSSSRTGSSMNYYSGNVGTGEYASPRKIAMVDVIFIAWGVVMLFIGVLKEGFSLIAFSLPLLLSGLPISFISLIGLSVSAVRKKPCKTWRNRLIIGAVMLIAGIFIMGSLTI